jgi:hypothetical protein
MSFDALTIGGMLVAILSGGFLVGVVTHNDSSGSDDSAGGRGGEGPADHGA